MATEENSRVLRIVSPMLLTMVCCSSAHAKTIYVDADAPGANDGSSWANAYRCLQDALAHARSGDEVRVAQGIYKPDQQVVIGGRLGARIVASGDRTASFELREGVAIRGGYAGFGTPDPGARDIRLCETVLSGDLNSDDGPDFANNAENSYHVVTAGGTNARTVLDGFTVTGGNANDTYGYGGGMDNRLGTPTVTNCTFSRNYGMRGGGMATREYSSPALANCVFRANRARWGGGMSIWQYGSGTLTNCTFSGNMAEDGGAIFITKGIGVTLKNCTLTANWASTGVAGAIYGSGDSSATLVNTILWGNGPSEIDLWESSITVTYSDVQGGWPGIGNIDADPLFANPRSGDYHLKSQAGRWSPDRQVWIQDDVTSPCIDAGDPSTPVAFEPFPNGGIVNMGAYAGTAEASKSLADLNTMYSGGSGTAQDPYQIATAADLIALGGTPADYDKHFVLTANIDLDPNLSGRKVFSRAVIAADVNDMDADFQGTPFRGVFNGNGHTISRLTIKGASYLGLFGQLYPPGVIGNLDVVDIHVTGSGCYVGGVVGDNVYGEVSKCCSTGVVCGIDYVGGVAGENLCGDVIDCQSEAAVSGTGERVGRIVGCDIDFGCRG